MIEILLLVAAIASDPPPNCKNPQTQLDMNQCAGADAERADAAMNRQWKITVEKIKKFDLMIDHTPDHKPGYYETLLKGQRAWLVYVEAHCTSEGYYARGESLEPLLYSQCKAHLTRDRTKQLLNLAADD